jgi:hypothetical protein
VPSITWTHLKRSKYVCDARILSWSVGLVRILLSLCSVAYKVLFCCEQKVMFDIQTWHDAQETAT